MKLSLAHTRLRKELKEYEKLPEKDRIRLILPEKEKEVKKNKKNMKNCKKRIE